MDSALSSPFDVGKHDGMILSPSFVQTSSQPKSINQILLFLLSTSSVLNVHTEDSGINSDPSRIAVESIRVQ